MPGKKRKATTEAAPEEEEIVRTLLVYGPQVDGGQSNNVRHQKTLFFACASLKNRAYRPAERSAKSNAQCRDKSHPQHYITKETSLCNYLDQKDCISLFAPN